MAKVNGKSEVTTNKKTAATSHIYKPSVKVLLTAGPTIIATILIGVLSLLFDKHVTAFFILLAVSIILSLISIGFSCWYATKEYNENAARSLVFEQNRVYEELLSGISSECNNAAIKINQVIHSIIEKGIADLEYWSFRGECDVVLKCAYKVVKNVLSTGNFEMAYVRKLEDEVDTICMISYVNSSNVNTKKRKEREKNKGKDQPTVYNIKRSCAIEKMNDISTYVDQKVFADGLDDYLILSNNSEVVDHFGYSTREQFENIKKRYHQFVAIPVNCGEKMIGLFEITGFEANVLGENEKEIRDLVDSYVVTFTSFLLLCYKIEKALTATPKNDLGNSVAEVAVK